MRTIMGFKIYTAEQIIEFLQGCIVNLFVLAVYIFVTIGLMRFVNSIVDRMFVKLLTVRNDHEYQKQVATIKNLVKSLANGVVVVIIALNFLARYNIDIRPLLTAAGVVGVAVGFASRRFVEDIIMGIFILLEGQVRVGDIVTIDNFNGTVEKVTLKMVIIRNMKGHVHYIRNGMINVITNKTREFACPLFDIGVAYNSDVDKVMNVMKSVADEMRKDGKYKHFILSDMDILGLDKFDDSAIIIRATIKTNPIHQWFIEREYNRLLKAAFDREGIEIPFPQRDVHLIKGE